MAGKRYPREFRERAVGLVLEQQAGYGSQWETFRSVAAKVNVSGETVRKWVRQAEVDAGARPGVDNTRFGVSASLCCMGKVVLDLGVMEAVARSYCAEGALFAGVLQ